MGQNRWSCTRTLGGHIQSTPQSGCLRFGLSPWEPQAPGPCPAAVEMRFQPPHSSIPPAFPGLPQPGRGACSSPGDRAHRIPAAAPGFAGWRSLWADLFWWHFSLSWCTDCSRSRHRSGILLAGIFTLPEDVSASLGGTSQALGGISQQWTGVKLHQRIVITEESESHNPFTHERLELFFHIPGNNFVDSVVSEALWYLKADFTFLISNSGILFFKFF